MINVCQPAAILTRLDVHPNRRNDIVCEAPFKIAGADAPPVHTDLHGNLCRRLTACPGDTTFELSGLMTDAGTPEPQLSDEPAWPVEKLPEECLVYLLASRYCETDVLAPMAWGSFGHLPHGAERVRAVVNYVHNHLTFGYRFARPTRTALDACNERVGVCRDLRT
jgi:transglutaminase-like putative cysteine protease